MFDSYLGCEDKVEGPDEVSDGSSWKNPNDWVVTYACQNPAHRPEHNWIGNDEHGGSYY